MSRVAALISVQAASPEMLAFLQDLRKVGWTHGIYYSML